MKNGKLGAAIVLLFGMMLCMTPSHAQTTMANEFNTPEVIETYGDGPNRNFVGVKHPERPLIVRGTPIDALVDLAYYNPGKNAYVKLRCMTPCKFTIPVPFALKMSFTDPIGYRRQSEPIDVKWVNTLFSYKLSPSDITVTFVKE